jgi:hypothetical protein
MGSFEWMEVETLSSEITALEDRLGTAKSRHNYGLVKVVKEQITAAHQRRARYLAHISTSVAESLDPSQPQETVTEAQPRQEEIAEPDQPGAEFADPDTPEVQEELEPDRPGAEPGDPIAQGAPEELAEPGQPSSKPVEPIAAGGVARAPAGTIDGAAELWDRLTPSHIERAKHALDSRRAEILARQAQELTALDVDQSEIDTLAQAIDAFVEKFNLPAAASSVVRLDEKRNRLQAD